LKLNLNFSVLENDAEFFFWIGQLENLEELELNKRENI
jgi:hypothetical protein